MCISALMAPEPRAAVLAAYGYSFVGWVCIRLYGRGLGDRWDVVAALVSERRRGEWRREQMLRGAYVWGVYLESGKWWDKAGGWYFDDTVLSTVIASEAARGSGSGGILSKEMGFWGRVKLAMRMAMGQRAVMALVFLVISVWSTESFITWHLHGGARVWGYGQITAVVLSGPPVMELVRMVLGATRKGEGEKSVMLIPVYSSDWIVIGGPDKREAPEEEDDVCVHKVLGSYCLYFPYYTNHVQCDDRKEDEYELVAEAGVGSWGMTRRCRFMNTWKSCCRSRWLIQRGLYRHSIIYIENSKENIMELIDKRITVPSGKSRAAILGDRYFYYSSGRRQVWRVK
jgi:hypothetical protein